MTGNARLVAAGPTFVKKPENEVRAEEEDVTFTCKAGGKPRPRLEWSINGVPVTGASRVTSRHRQSGADVCDLSGRVRFTRADGAGAPPRSWLGDGMRCLRFQSVCFICTLRAGRVSPNG